LNVGAPVGKMIGNGAQPVTAIDEAPEIPPCVVCGRRVPVDDDSYYVYLMVHGVPRFPNQAVHMCGRCFDRFTKKELGSEWYKPPIEGSPN
jgi:hypothetical protein